MKKKTFMIGVSSKKMSTFLRALCLHFHYLFRTIFLASIEPYFKIHSKIQAMTKRTIRSATWRDCASRSSSNLFDL